MQTLFLINMLSLIATLQAQDPMSPVLEEQKFTGTWYMKAIVANKHPSLEKKPEKVSPLTVIALEDGDLVFLLSFLKKGQCHKKIIMLERAGEHGEYTTKEDRVPFFFQELPVKDHYTIFCEASYNGRNFRFAKLLGKSLDLSLEALEESEKLTQKKENCTPEIE